MSSLRNRGTVGRVLAAVKDFFLDLALPRTDRAVFIQWAIMIPLWIGGIVASRKQSSDIRLFIVGVIMLNLAWFGFRMVH